MKILKYEADPKDWHKEVKCNTCKTVLEIDCSDIKYMGDLGDYRDPGWERYWVICEACGLESTLKSEDLPFIIKRTAQLNGIKK